jgi:hypothetical protein
MCRHVSFINKRWSDDDARDEEMAMSSDSHWCLLHDQPAMESADDGCDDFESTIRGKLRIKRSEEATS